MKTSHPQNLYNTEDGSILNKILDTLLSTDQVVFYGSILILVVITILVIYLLKHKRFENFDIEILASMTVSYTMLAVIFSA